MLCWKNETFVRVCRERERDEPQIWLKSIVSTPIKNLNMITDYENLIFKLYIFYVLNTYIKFCINWKQFTIHSLNLFFYI